MIKLGGRKLASQFSSGKSEGGWGDILGTGRRLLENRALVEELGTPKLWDLGHKGAGVKVAIMDTGIREDHPHFNNIMDRTEWTHDGIKHDTIGASLLPRLFCCPDPSPYDTLDGQATGHSSPE